MKCKVCLYLDLYYDDDKILKERCLKNHTINRSGCDDFLDIEMYDELEGDEE